MKLINKLKTRLFERLYLLELVDGRAHLQIPLQRHTQAVAAVSRLHRDGVQAAFGVRVWPAINAPWWVRRSRVFKLVCHTAAHKAISAGCGMVHGQRHKRTRCQRARAGRVQRACASLGEQCWSDAGNGQSCERGKAHVDGCRPEWLDSPLWPSAEHRKSACGYVLLWGPFLLLICVKCRIPILPGPTMPT
jgi:hypothetical protein